MEIRTDIENADGGELRRARHEAELALINTEAEIQSIELRLREMSGLSHNGEKQKAADKLRHLFRERREARQMIARCDFLMPVEEGL